MKTQNRSFVYSLAIIAALSGLLFGYDTGVISGAILFVQKEFALSPQVEGVIVSAVLFGAILGAAFSGRLADRFGRRNMIITASLFFIAGSLLTALTSGLILLGVGRIIVGLAIGIASYTAPLYISEIAPQDVRGKLVSFNQLAITCGIVVSYLVDFAFAHVVEGWRWMFGMAVVPALILLIGMIFLPETPRWLVSRNRDLTAKIILRKVEGKENVDKEVDTIRHTLELEKNTGGFKELFKGWVRPALVIGIGLAFFQQVTGINTVIYYAPTIFNLAGFESNAASILATVGVGIVNVLMTIVALWLVDKVGRRPLLLWGLIGMIIALFALGLAFFLPSLSVMLHIISVVSLMVYVAAFAIGLGPIFWLMIAEIYPLKIRGLAMSMATVANWLFNLIVALTFLSLIHGLGASVTFWLYAFLSILAWIFCYKKVPETKGKSLEEIEYLLREGKIH